jgi:hypothetical protein
MHATRGIGKSIMVPQAMESNKKRRCIFSKRKEIIAKPDCKTLLKERRTNNGY